MQSIMGRVKGETASVRRLEVVKQSKKKQPQTTNHTIYSQRQLDSESTH